MTSERTRPRPTRKSVALIHKDEAEEGTQETQGGGRRAETKRNTKTNEKYRKAEDKDE